MTTPHDLLTGELRRDGTRPFITWYGEGGARVELSVATTANWVSKTSGYLLDEVGLDHGEPVRVDPTPHWLTAVVLLAAWAVGAEVDFDQSPEAAPLEVPLDPMGAVFSRAVAAYPDRFAAIDPSGREPLAEAPAVESGARILTVMRLDAAGVGYGLLSPLAAAGSVVYARADAALGSIAVAERVTHTAGIDVPGVPRLA